MDLDMMMNHTMMMNMPMYFRFTSDIPHLLFRTWTVDNAGELVGAMVFSFILAILYEGLKTGKDIVMKKSEKYNPPSSSTINTSEGNVTDLHTFVPHRRLKLWLMRLVISLLRTIEVGMAYLLMLLAMTYNVWIFLSVCFGAGTGFFVFISVRPYSSRTSDDHCG